VLFFLIGVGIGRPIIENLVFAIGIIVANVPEGLLSTVTVALSITAKRMAAKSVLVKNLEAVETLGSTSCICSDKTGTLTMNVMTVAHVYYDFTIKQVDHHNPLQGEFDTRNASMQHLIRVAACCNNCVYEIGVDEKGNEIQDIKGDASEKGITKVSAPHIVRKTGWAVQCVCSCDSHILCSVCFDCVLSAHVHAAVL
jgi:sodium/potassium-transporting ATPase subunit alpha